MFFRSRITDGNPFAPQSAFDSASLDSAPVHFAGFDCSASFRSSEAVSSSASTDHLSVGVGAGVDMVVLEASVPMHYDKDVMENRDSNKASVTTSYRAGSVALVRPPELSADAFRILYKQGVDEFKAVYEDYYVGGYQIGGDASALFSTDSSNRSETETKRVQIRVETWLTTHEEQWSMSSTSTEQNAEVRISAYSTIEQLLVAKTVRMGTPSFRAAIDQGRGIHRRAQALEDELAKVLKEVGVGEGKLMTPRQCAQLCIRAVVVELLLVPVECLRQVRYWPIIAL
ncbi:hypothetical protein V2G26_001966 [Clonostachys chloroleuca]